jgi:hypothetical protein
MSGYIALGLIMSFMFVIINHYYPYSFSGVNFNNVDYAGKVDTFLYFSYVTLMTLGYGDIYPLTPIAQKATILCGLIGQFYLVIITAVIVGKFMQNSIEQDRNN